MPKAIQIKKEVAAPWKDICCHRCFIAKSDKKKCKCRCKGNHHGEAYKTKNNDKKTEIQEGDIWLSEEDLKKHEEWMEKQKPQ